MRVRKPRDIYTKSFIFRPRETVSGKFSVGFSVEIPPGLQATAIIDWCGSKRHLAFGPGMAGFVTNLRLPITLTQGDVFVLSVSAWSVLIISVGMYGEEAALETVDIEEVDDGPFVATICADPTTDGNRSFDDVLATSVLVSPKPVVTPLGRIESLRAFPDGGILIFTFLRPPKAKPDSDFMIHLTVGEFRLPCIMASWRTETRASFRLHAAAAAESWELTLSANHAFLWSATIHRNFDTNFLPAFSLVM